MLRIGKLKTAAWSMARTLATSSDEFRAAQLSDPVYQNAFGKDTVKGFTTRAEFEAGMEKRRARNREIAIGQLCTAAYNGNARAFRALADCVEFIKKNGIEEKWSDPLAQQIHDYVFDRWVESLAKTGRTDPDSFMRENDFFNIEQFIEDTGTEQDRATINKRVRALGYRVNKGRPTGSKNKKR